MSKCDQIKGLLADYAVGGLSRRARSRVEAHVETCASCREELRALERTGALLDAVGMEAAPEDWEHVQARILARTRKRTRPALRFAWAAAAAALLALLVYGGVVRLPGGQMIDPEAAAVAEAETELRSTMEDHLAAVWAAPLTDEAAIGLRLGALEEDRS